MTAVCSAGGVGVVASSTLASGVLSGKYAAPGASVQGRVADQLDSPRYQAALRVAASVQAVAARLDQPPAAVALAYALANPLVASVLFGATSAAQIQENVQALTALEQLSPSVLEELRSA